MNADVVVVGGGIVGTSAAYHLAAAGAGHVVLLERSDVLAAGATGACAGGFRCQFSSEVNIRLSQASVPMIVGFTEEHGIPVDVWRDGYLFLVRREADLAGYERALALQQALGVRSERITGPEAAALVPGIEVGDVIAAFHCGDDGIADPSALTHGYATLARRLGVDIRLGTAATSLLLDGRGVRGVATSAGEIAARVVVNAAGPWAAALAASAGVELPVEPVPRNVVVTSAFDAAPSRRTLVIDAATSFYFHREGDGVLMGMGRPDETASFDTTPDAGFIEGPLLETALRVFPPLERAGIAATWAGLYEMTPDRLPVIGRAPSVSGLILANGFSGHGFQHGPVVGRLISEIVVEGAARTVDISSLGLERFAAGDLVREGHVV